MSSIRHWVASQYHQMALKRVLDSKQITHYRILGVRRSGNHAIISWILSGLEGMSSFCNDLQPGDAPQTARIKKTKAGSKSKANLLCSYEDYRFEEVFTKENLSKSPTKAPVIDIIILRDSYNLLASWIAWQADWGKSFRKQPTYRKKIIATWKNHAQHVLNQNNKPSPPLVHISYNDWLSNPSYREQLAQRLNMVKAPEKLPNVSKFGYGSSFDGLAHLHHPEKMAVLERWKQVETHPIFQEIAADQEIQTLNKALFGWSPL